MSATQITVVGYVADSPRRVRLQNASVTNFRLASTERRFDRERQEFVDGGTLWTDVECWGELGGNVSQTISKGDPVVVVGTITTRSYESENGRGSVSQIRAEAVGPNLARGVALDFRRTVRPASAATAHEPVPDEAPGEEDAERLVESDEPRAGSDYIPAPSALHEPDSDDAILEPALR